MKNLGLIAAVFLFAGVGAASADSGVNGRYVSNHTQFCTVTSVNADGTTTVNTQSALVSGTFNFHGGWVTFDFVQNSVNSVPAGTRATATGFCEGPIILNSDGSIATDFACHAETIDGTGVGNVSDIPHVL